MNIICIWCLFKLGDSHLTQYFLKVFSQQRGIMLCPNLPTMTSISKKRNFRLKTFHKRACLWLPGHLSRPFSYLVLRCVLMLNILDALQAMYAALLWVVWDDDSVFLMREVHGRISSEECACLECWEKWILSLRPIHKERRTKIKKCWQFALVPFYFQHKAHVSIVLPISK